MYRCNTYSYIDSYIFWEKSLFLKYIFILVINVYARFSYFMNASFKLIFLYSISVVRYKHINTYIDMYFLLKYILYVLSLTLPL